MLADLEDQLDPKHSALVLVDLQNDFVDPAGWVARTRPAGQPGDTGVALATERAGILLRAARDAEVLIAHVRMIGDARYLSEAQRVMNRRNTGTEAPDCVLEGTWGADLAAPVAPIESDREIVVDKHRYSSFIGTRLHLVLRSHGIRTIVVCGVATSGCVESTIRDGFMLDHHVVVPADACGDYDEERQRAALAKISGSYAIVTDVDRVATCWRR